MFYKITDFIRAHKSAIRVVLGFGLLIAGLLLVINRRPFAGGIVFLAGIALITISLGKILGPSDYASSSIGLNFNGMGQQTSSINKKQNSNVANEVTSDIWNQMTQNDHTDTAK